jgi:polyhydroxyalkanoate synthesis regulator phasin
MTITELAEKLTTVVDYLRQTEQSRNAEAESQQADIDSLLARVAALEDRLSAIE